MPLYLNISMYGSNIITQNAHLLEKLILSKYKKCYQDIFWCILILNPTVSSIPLITVITAQTSIITNRFRCCCTYNHISR